MIMMRTIKDKLLEINQGETWNSDKVEKTEKFVEEFAIGYGEWLFDHYNIISCYNRKELLEIYIKTL